MLVGAIEIVLTEAEQMIIQAPTTENIQGFYRQIWAGRRSVYKS